MGFSRQEYWSVLPFPSPGDLPNPGIKPGSLALQADSLPSEPLGKPYIGISSVQFSCSVVSDSLRPHESKHARPPSPSPTPRVYSNPCPSSWWCHPTISSLLLLPPIPPNIRAFSKESTLCMRWPKYWSFSFSISPSNEHPGLISFKIDWLDILAVQGTLKSLLQHDSSKASIFWRSATYITKWNTCSLGS